MPALAPWAGLSYVNWEPLLQSYPEGVTPARVRDGTDGAMPPDVTSTPIQNPFESSSNGTYTP